MTVWGGKPVGVAEMGDSDADRDAVPDGVSDEDGVTDAVWDGERVVEPVDDADWVPEGVACPLGVSEPVDERDIDCVAEGDTVELGD